MTERKREPEAGAPDGAGVERLRGHFEDRARRADERERVADRREAIADERDQLADERGRIADVREWQQSQARAPRPGDMQRRRRETLRQARRANERDRAGIDRLEAGLAREDTDRHRQAAKLDYETARSELEHDNTDRTR